VTLTAPDRLGTDKPHHSRNDGGKDYKPNDHAETHAPPVHHPTHMIIAPHIHLRVLSYMNVIVFALS
jgi:hypothetical protein